MPKELIEKLEYVCQLRKEGLITNDEEIKANMIEAYFSKASTHEVMLKEALVMIKNLEDAGLISSHLSKVARNSLAEKVTKKWSY